MSGVHLRGLCVWSTEGFGRNTSIVVFVDRLSKIAVLAAVVDPIDVEGTVSLFIDRVSRQHGLTLSIVSDRDFRFMGKVWNQSSR